MKPQNLEDIYDLSPLQLGILFQDSSAPGSGIYVEQIVATFQGELDVAVLKQTWQTLLDRNPVLRTSFHWEGLDRPLQAVHRKLPVPFEELDLTALPAAEQAERLAAFLQADRVRGFKLSRAPLMRLTLFRLAADVYKLAWRFHHIILDGWSFALVLQEFVSTYKALWARGDPAIEPRRPYRDYISWLKRQDRGLAEAFWREKLRGVSGATRLQIGPTPAQLPAGEPTHERMEIRLTAAPALRALARKHHLTIATLVQGAWHLLLHHYTGADEIVAGVTVAGRPPHFPGMERIVGMMIHTLPTRETVSGTTPVLAWLEEFQKHQSDAQQYDHAPLVEIHRWSGLPVGVPLIDSIVVIENVPLPSVSLRDERLEIMDSMYDGRPHYPISLILFPDPDMPLRIIYDRRRFEPDAIARLLHNMQTLVDAIAEDIERPIASLPYVSEHERRQVIVEWNRTSTDDRADRCIHELFEAQVEASPEAVALVFEGARITYRELNRRANQLAHHLRRRGVGPDVVVGVHLERSPEMIIGLLAIHKAGGAYLPLDPSYPEPRLAAMIAEARPRVVLTLARGSERIMAAERICIDSEAEAIAGEPAGNLGATATPDSVAYVLYTSGSTGRPKGVLGLHRGAVNRFAWMWRAFPFAPGEVCCHKTTLSFVDAVWEIFGPLLQGIPLLVVPEAAMRDLARLIGILADARITRVVLVPSLLASLLDAEPELARALPDLRYWTTSGEALSAELCARFRDQLPGRVLLNLYGCSEASADATAFVASELRGTDRVPIGRPLDNVRIYILDANLGPAPIGVAGEIAIGGVCLARGYLDQPELTAERFIVDPFSTDPGARMYRTGDRGRYLPSGEIEYLGRRDHQVKIRGFRVEIAEIEAALRQHPDVSDFAVVDRDAAAGKELVAYVVAREQRTIDAHAVREVLAGCLPDFMIPSRLVTLDRLPLTPSGKLDRQALPPVHGAELPKARTFVAPRTPTEQALAGIWEHVLEVHPVGVTDSFFELGGNSIVALRMLARIQKQLGRSLPLSTLIHAMTIESMAAAMADGDRPRSPLVRIQEGGTRRPFFCVHPAGGHVFAYVELAKRLGPDQPFYGLEAVHRGGEVTVEQLAANYLEEVVSAQPRGPYQLGGWSFGGVVAFEMARQLRARGARVAPVILIDSWTPTPELAPTKLDDDAFLAVLIHEIGGYLGQPLDVSVSDLARLAPERRMAFALERAQAVQTSLVMPSLERTIDAMQNVFLSNIAAMHRYEPRAWPEQLIVYRAGEQAAGASMRPHTDPTLGWDRVAPGRIQVRIAPGNHYTMFGRDNVGALAALLRHDLARNQEPAHGSS